MTLVLAWAIFKSILKAYQLTQHIGWHEKWWQIGHGGASDWNAVQQQQQRQLWSIQIVRCHSIHVSFVPRCIQSVALAKRLLFLSNFLVLFRVCRRRRHCRHCTADLFRTNGPRLLLDRRLFISDSVDLQSWFRLGPDRSWLKIRGHYKQDLLW